MGTSHKLLGSRPVHSGQVNLQIHFEPVTDRYRADPDGRRHRGTVGDRDLSCPDNKLHCVQKQAA